MQQAIIHIPEPCHENWEAMNATEKGKFCGSCQKEVIDFTGMTDAELFAFFAKKNIGNVCGRMHSSQLNTPITKPVVHKKKRFWYVQYIATLLLLLTRPGSNVKAQTKPPTTTSSIRPIVLGNIMPMPQPVPNERRIDGSIHDLFGAPVPFASIFIKGTKMGTVSDEKGNFHLQVKKEDVLVVSAIKFETSEILVQDKTTVNITLINNISEVTVGIIITNTDGEIAYNTPRYKTLLQVTDKDNSAPIANASISISRNNKGKPKQIHANSKGEYLLRKIKEGDTYTITVSADGYQTSSITINSYALSKGQNINSIQLKKEVEPTDIILGKMIPTPTNKINVCPTTEITVENTSPIPGQLRGLAGVVGGMTVTTITEKPSDTLAPIKKIIDTLFSSKKVTATQDAQIKVYPNPVNNNGMVTIAFGKVPKGSYNLELFNTAGSLIQQQQITVPAEQFNFQCQLDKQVATGNYIIIVNNSKGEQSYNGKITIL